MLHVQYDVHAGVAAEQHSLPSWCSCMLLHPCSMWIAVALCYVVRLLLGLWQQPVSGQSINISLYSCAQCMRRLHLPDRYMYHEGCPAVPHSRVGHWPSGGPSS
jgi:hypothetical protein